MGYYRSYRVLRDRTLRGKVCAVAGDIVHDQRGYDYGLSNDDTHHFGRTHISVTHSATGDYPGFTIPLDDLEPIGPAPWEDHP